MAWSIARKQFSTMALPRLKVGYVPEHFSTPLFFAREQGYYAKNGVEIEFLPFPSGSGHLIQSLKDKSIGELGLAGTNIHTNFVL